MSSVSIGGLEEATRPVRLFLVRGHKRYGFYSGICPDGRQVLAAADGQKLVVGLFGPRGELNRVEQATLHQSEDVEDHLAREFGAIPGPVRVKRFRIPAGKAQAPDPMQTALIGESGFAISPLPPDWYEFLADPTRF